MLMQTCVESEDYLRRQHMPHKSRHPCKHPGCPALIESGETFCAVHKGTHKDDYARKHPEYFKLYNSKQWRRLRRMFLAEHPLCVNFDICHNAATVVDHITDHRGIWELFIDMNNLQPMCASCHNTKTAKERGWGKGQLK